MSKPPTGGKRDSRTPPTPPLPCTSPGHHPARPPPGVSASYTLSGVAPWTPILCRMSTISVLLPGALDRLGDPLDPLQSCVPRGPDRRQLGHRAGELGVVHAVALFPAGRRRMDQAGPV